MVNRVLLAFILSVSTAAAVAEVYRWTDEHGNIIFSDTPEKGAEKIELNETTVVPALKTPRRTERLSPAESSKFQTYQAVAISSPTNEETLRNVQTVTVKVNVTPALSAGDLLQLYYDGQPYGPAQSDVQFLITEAERGAHQLAVAIVSPAGQELKRSATSVFYLHRQIVQPRAKSAP